MLCAERLVFITEFAEVLRLWGTGSTHCALDESGPVSWYSDHLLVNPTKRRTRRNPVFSEGPVPPYPFQLRTE